jgi:putative transposase
MKRLVDTEEAARVLGASKRTIERWFMTGKIEGQFCAGGKGGGKGGQVLKVWIDPENTQRAKEGDSPDSTPSTNSGRKSGTVPNRYKIHRGEPGCRVVTPLINGEPIINIEQNNKIPAGGLLGKSQTLEEVAILPRVSPMLRGAIPAEPETAILPSSSPPSPCEVISPSQGTFFPVPTESQKSKEIGYLRMALLKAWREEISKNGKPKGQVTKEFLECYNFGRLLPYIYDTFEKISRATLYNWDRAEKSGGVQALIPQYHAPAPGPITESEKYILLNTLLHQNRLKVGTAIKFTKTFLAYKKYPSPSSESKLRRFADDFKKTRYDVWVEAREGAKALNDKCLPYAERDWRLLTVGEGLVADGHRLNFQVIDPFTGKPCRATIVLFWDWKSSYPVGWEIMLEESIQCIASALRNAIVCLGKVPKWLLIDNGKAFKAKCFTSEIELEDGILYGMFATLGIHTHFSQAYNPQEKPLERFWGTFNNWFERLLPSYTGASIEDKPAYMRRNEKDAQARHNKWVPRIEQVQEMLHNWREFYADQRSRGRDEMKPREIFEAEKGPGVDQGDLYHLMMVKETKAVHRNGITFNGWHYYNEALYGLKDNVLIKYSLSDFSKIYCFYKNELLCVAEPIEPVHPMASESECPKNQEAVKRGAALKSKVRWGTKNLLSLIESGQGTDLGDSFRRSPEVAEVVKAIEDKRKPSKISSLYVDPAVEETIPSGISGEELRFEYSFERYEYLLKKEALADSESKFINDYKAGIIAPGEYEHIYGERRLDRERKVCND